jgi:trans-2,3-dihydro-3-hydroxyanthranilate isomerase
MQMKSYKFFQVDVFTETAFAGNPLAVIPEPEGLSENLMQKIAREMHLSETSFVFPPEGPEADFRLRIFTPTHEIPFAGHPVIGTAHILSTEGYFEFEAGKPLLCFELGIGKIEVTKGSFSGSEECLTMRQPLPKFADYGGDRKQIVELLGLSSSSELAEDLPLKVISTGSPFLMIPLRSEESLKRVKVNLSVLEKVSVVAGTTAVAPFVANHPGVGEVTTRVFAPFFGVPEDPATGSAAGCFGSYMITVLGPGKSKTREFIINQGAQLGRPSRIFVRMELEGKNIVGVLVAGSVVKVAEGVLRF